MKPEKEKHCKAKKKRNETLEQKVKRNCHGDRQTILPQQKMRRLRTGFFLSDFCH